MRILGIDPGTRKTGVGLIESKGNHYSLLHCQVISIKDSLTIPEKLSTIYHTLSKIIKIHEPDVLALENIFYSKNVRSMLRIGEARACAMLAASDQGLSVVEYPPARVKQAVCGNGRASKDQIQAMVKTLLNMKRLPPPDGADALALAICHLHQKNSRRLQGEAKKGQKSLKELLQRK